MNRRGFIARALAAPAIIRSGVLMPVVPLVIAPLPFMGNWSDAELLQWVNDAMLRTCGVDLGKPGGDISGWCTVNRGIITEWGYQPRRQA